ncbi:hypothetical protein IAU60_006534 [Kwoniella sp. DSM 27419]
MVRIALLTSLLAAGSAMAHCQLAWPFPLHSPLNPKTPEAIKDYSMTSPLITSGTYPCKGYINNPSSDMDSVASFAAGDNMNFTIAGTATHGGGSCQISMSYDLGVTWNVIFSQVGGCLVDGMTTTITIPSEAPSGEALFAWGWFNRLGNREMYHNCASVTIRNGGSGLSGDDFPTPFVANAEVNECKTIEGIDVVFPNPGKNVQYGGGYASSRPTTPAGFIGSNCVGPGATENSSSGGTSAPASTSASSVPEATTTSSATSAENTEYTLSLSPDTTTLSESSTAAAPASTAVVGSGHKTCKSRRSRSAHGHALDRRQRLIRRPRDTKRVAASKAEHVAHSARAVLGSRQEGVKRVAASKAEHNLRLRDGTLEAVRS